MCLYPTWWLCGNLPELSGDVQGETGQSSTSSSNTTNPHPPDQLATFRLRLLARAGLWGPGDIGPVPAASCCAIFRFHPRGSHHHGLQSHGTIGWLQPDRTPPDCQGPGCGGDVAADVQDYQRSCPLTEEEIMTTAQLYAASSQRCLRLSFCLVLPWGTSCRRFFMIHLAHLLSSLRQGLKMHDICSKSCIL